MNVQLLLNKRNKQIREAIENFLHKSGVAVLPLMDVEQSLKLVQELGIKPKVTMLDPWYNKGVGGVRGDYKEYIIRLLNVAGSISEHVFLWGFPEIVAYFVDNLPSPLTLVAWLTWYYKNNPSVIRGWRSSQNACLHLSKPGAKLYPEHFLNEAQKNLKAQGKLRYMPGPTSVIEAALLVGFVGRKEQTGHPSQKPVSVFEKLLLMTTEEGDLVFDPMSGSGTSGEAGQKLGCPTILSDESEEYTRMVENRLNVNRIIFREESTKKVTTAKIASQK